MHHPAAGPLAGTRNSSMGPMWSSVNYVINNKKTRQKTDKKTREEFTNKKPHPFKQINQKKTNHLRTYSKTYILDTGTKCCYMIAYHEDVTHCFQITNEEKFKRWTRKNMIGLYVANLKKMIGHLIYILLSKVLNIHYNHNTYESVFTNVLLTHTHTHTHTL